MSYKLNEQEELLSEIIALSLYSLKNIKELSHNNADYVANLVCFIAMTMSLFVEKEIKEDRQEDKYKEIFTFASNNIMPKLGRKAIIDKFKKIQEGE